MAKKMTLRQRANAEVSAINYREVHDLAIKSWLAGHRANRLTRAEALEDAAKELAPFLALWAEEYARRNEFAPSEIHPDHYALMVKYGLRVDDYKPATIRALK